MMIGFASGEYIDHSGTVTIVLPTAAKDVVSVLYGDASWTVSGNLLSKSGLGGLEIGLLVLGLS